jgi:hypothetical protein
MRVLSKNGRDWEAINSLNIPDVISVKNIYRELAYGVRGEIDLTFIESLISVVPYLTFLTSPSSSLLLYNVDDLSHIVTGKLYANGHPCKSVM